MIYDWYKVYKRQEFIDSGLVSREVELFLEGQGTKKILLTRGVGVSIVYEGILLKINLNNRNPFKFEDHAVFLGADDYIYLGIKKDES